MHLLGHSFGDGDAPRILIFCMRPQRPRANNIQGATPLEILYPGTNSKHAICIRGTAVIWNLYGLWIRDANTKKGIFIRGTAVLWNCTTWRSLYPLRLSPFTNCSCLSPPDAKAQDQSWARAKPKTVDCCIISLFLWLLHLDTAAFTFFVFCHWSYITLLRCCCRCREAKNLLCAQLCSG